MPVTFIINQNQTTITIIRHSHYQRRQNYSNFLPLPTPPPSSLPRPSPPSSCSFIIAQHEVYDIFLQKVNKHKAIIKRQPRIHIIHRHIYAPEQHWTMTTTTTKITEKIRACKLREEQENKWSENRLGNNLGNSKYRINLLNFMFPDFGLFDRTDVFSRILYRRLI